MDVEQGKIIASDLSKEILLYNEEDENTKNKLNEKYEEIIESMNNKIVNNLKNIESFFLVLNNYRAQGKSLNTTVELRDNFYNNTKRSVNLGEEAEKQLRAYINSCQRRLNGTSYRVAHTVTGDQKFTNDEDKDLNQKYGGEHALKAAIDAANRLLNLIHKWRTRYR